MLIDSTCAPERLPVVEHKVELRAIERRHRVLPPLAAERTDVYPYRAVRLPLVPVWLTAAGDSRGQPSAAVVLKRAPP